MQVSGDLRVSHDSIGLGQDGPTHQPIEQLAALRAMPGLTVIRPADANETVEAWRTALKLRRRSASSSRARPCRSWTAARYAPAAGVAKGGYVLIDAEGGRTPGHPDRHRQRGDALRRGAAGAGEKGVRARVVSMPSFELFEAQPKGVSRKRAAGGDHRPRRGRGRRARSAGPLRRPPPARSSPCTASANPPDQGPDAPLRLPPPTMCATPRSLSWRRTSDQSAAHPRSRRPGRLARLSEQQDHRRR